MYLELSRPRGELSRWEKVYERLLLFNEFLPPTSCSKANQGKGLKGFVTAEQVEKVLSFIIENDCIFAGADLANLYEDTLRKIKGMKQRGSKWILSSKKPIVFLSTDPEKHAQELVYGWDTTDTSKKLSIKTHTSTDVDLVPSMTFIYQGKRLCVLIVHQSACQAYFTVALGPSRNLKIASMDTLITLYFSLGLYRSVFFDIGSMECLAEKLVQISLKARSNPHTFPFPFISIKCVGHQKTLPSLIRSKVKRITKKKINLKQILGETE